MKTTTTATERYIAPLDEADLRGAILSIGVHHPKKENDAPPADENLKFILEIFEEREEEREEEIIEEVTTQVVKVENGLAKFVPITEKITRKITNKIVNKVPPRSWIAIRFVETRFKHGFRRTTKQGAYHPIYHVAITDFSCYLIQAWTGKKIFTDEAKQLYDKIMLREENAEVAALRVALFKDFNAPLLAEAERIKKSIGDTAAERRRLYEEQQKRNGNGNNNDNNDNQNLPPLPTLSLTEEQIKELNLVDFTTPNTTTNTTTPELKIYQKVAATNAILAEDGYGLFLQPGTGKTAIAIAKIDAVAKMVSEKCKRPALILIGVPKNIRQNWGNELLHFSKSFFVCCQLAGANEQIRSYRLIDILSDRTNLSQQAIIVIGGYEAIVGTPLVEKVEWDIVIVDESHSISNPVTKRTKFFLKLRDKARFRIPLTGTPIRNSLFDLWSQLEFIGKGYSGCDSFTAFKELMGVWTNNPYKGYRSLSEYRNIPLLQERLAKYCCLMTKEEVLPYLPDKVYDTLEASLTQQQYKVYRQLATMLQAKIEDSLARAKASNMSITVNNILTQLLRLAQITSGYAVLDVDDDFDPEDDISYLENNARKGSVYRFDPNPKLELLVEEVKEYLEIYPNSKVQIWACFRENVKQIFSRFHTVENIPSVMFYGDTSDPKRIEAEKEFNCNPKTKLFIGNPQAGGVGLNLLGFDPYNPNKYITNCDWVIYYSQNWSTISRRQSEDRGHRQGTRVPVRITDLVVPGSIETEIISRVRAKIDMAMNVQDLRQVMRNLLTAVQVNGD